MHLTAHEGQPLEGPCGKNTTQRPRAKRPPKMVREVRCFLPLRAAPDLWAEAKPSGPGPGGIASRAGAPRGTQRLGPAYFLAHCPSAGSSGLNRRTPSVQQQAKSLRVVLKEGQRKERDSGLKPHPSHDTAAPACEEPSGQDLGDPSLGKQQNWHSHPASPPERLEPCSPCSVGSRDLRSSQHKGS